MTEPRMPMDLTCDEVRDLAASFVLGALDDDEMDAVRAHLAGHVDAPMDVAHPEFLELASVLPVLAVSVPEVEPPAGLKDRILAAAAADLEARGAGSPTPFPSAAERQQRAERTRTSTGSWILRIAAVLAIVVLGGWNLLLQGQLNETQAFQQNVATVLDAAGQPGSLTAILKAEGGGPNGLAAVDASGKVTLAMRDLPATTGNEVYETWVIPSDGVPRALGGFTVGTDGTAYFEGTGLPTEPGMVLALTREPAPGATAPGGPVVSAGAATAG
jgi:anti-sigma-K factor RskA